VDRCPVPFDTLNVLLPPSATAISLSRARSETTDALGSLLRITRSSLFSLLSQVTLEL